MCKTPIAYLLHILEECNYILSFNGNILLGREIG